MCDFDICFTFKPIKAQTITEYWENDTLKIKGQLVDEERHGFWQKWYSNGELEYEGDYNHGMSDGTWKYYCKHGYLEKVVNWEGGKCYGVVDYFLSGQPSVYLHFKEGLDVQQYLQYHRIEEWCKGNQERITSRRLDNKEEDSLVHYPFITIAFLPANGLEQIHLREKLLHYKDSIIIIEMMKNNYLVQFCKSLKQKFEYTEYFYEGAGNSTNITRTVKFFGDSVLLDLSTTFYEIEPYGPYEQMLYLDEKRISTVKYDLNDSEKQSCKHYYEGGQVESIIPYKNRQIHGKVKRFSKTGKLTFQGKYKEGELIKSKK